MAPLPVEDVRVLLRRLGDGERRVLDSLIEAVPPICGPWSADLISKTVAETCRCAPTQRERWKERACVRQMPSDAACHRGLKIDGTAASVGVGPTTVDCQGWLSKEVVRKADHDAAAVQTR